MPINTDVTYNLFFGDKCTYQLLPADKLGHARPQPGIYGWHLQIPNDPPSAQDIIRYCKIWSARSLDVEASAPLGTKYEGTIRRMQDLKQPGDVRSDIRYASTVFSPPIYVGVSENIRNRLDTHLGQLEDKLWTAAPESDPDVRDEHLADSVRESAYFGERVGELLDAVDIADTKWLFVKILYLSELTRSELTTIEYYLNRLFTPLCGRK